MGRIMLKAENVSKQYRLGQIGGTTFREELQRLSAKMLHREDPGSRIGDAGISGGEPFMALDGVSFEVEHGERVGIIGRNGAGKSTLLKLISRITAPTRGDIWIDGRVASMLEVGTGFNGELTGRENIYMNGAILGMKKKEIDAKIGDIIDFSECGQFINTPVKRYSSGMYVKLAFSVAAHLDAELMIMDEVLAVGDMAFQKKCLEKMGAVSRQEGKTILYVSHNMNTIRQLCGRCIVLDGGKLVFDGDVEEAINRYMDIRTDTEKLLDLRTTVRQPEFSDRAASMTELECLEAGTGAFPPEAKVRFRLGCRAGKTLEDVLLRAVVKDLEGRPVTMMTTDRGVRLGAAEETQLFFTLDLSRLAPGKYTLTMILYQADGSGREARLDMLKDLYCFEITQPPGFNRNMEWAQRRWGYFFNRPIEFTVRTGAVKDPAGLSPGDDPQRQG